MMFFKSDRLSLSGQKTADRMTPVRPGEFLNRWSGEFNNADLEHAFRSDLGEDGKRREWSLFIIAIWLLCDTIPITLVNAAALGWGPTVYTFIGFRVCVAVSCVMMIIAVWRRDQYRHLDQIALPMLVFMQIAASVIMFKMETLDAQAMVGNMSILAAGFFFAPYHFKLRLVVSCLFAVAVFYRFGLEAASGSVTATFLTYWAAAAFVMAMIAARMFRAHRRTVFIYRQTELKHIEQLRGAYDEAANANQMKTHFVASTAHDLRNPLNAVLGFSEIIESQIYGPDQTEKYREAARDIHKCAHQMLHQIESLLDAAVLEARPQKLHLEAIDLQAMTTRVIRQAKASNRDKRLTFITQIPDDLSPLFADQNAIHQVLVNLVTNAQKFTPDGGEIAITADRVGAETVIRVIDSGSGIPENQQGQVTDRFTVGRAGRLSREPGWGLGLSIVDALIRAHGGRLGLSANKPRGTVATIHLPLPGQARAAE